MGGWRIDEGIFWKLKTKEMELSLLVLFRDIEGSISKYATEKPAT